MLSSRSGQCYSSQTCRSDYCVDTDLYKKYKDSLCYDWGCNDDAFTDLAVYDKGDPFCGIGNDDGCGVWNTPDGIVFYKNESYSYLYSYIYVISLYDEDDGSTFQYNPNSSNACACTDCTPIDSEYSECTYEGILNCGWDSAFGAVDFENGWFMPDDNLWDIINEEKSWLNQELQRYGGDPISGTYWSADNGYYSSTNAMEWHKVRAVWSNRGQSGLHNLGEDVWMNGEGSKYCN